MQVSLFDDQHTEKWNKQILHDLFKAYFDARRNKRNTINQLNFEIQYEQNVFGLFDEIINYAYKPSRSICFIVNKPVKREIFAADFRDRVVHHLIYNYIAPYFERLFINDCYSCRPGKGTHYGIKRMDHFIRSCSGNYSKPCHILKLDIKGYFMSINRYILFDKVTSVLHRFRERFTFDSHLLNYLLKQVIFNDPTAFCLVKGKSSDWQGLPESKSLFHTKQGCGLPIGNLTSQLFGNIYLSDFDHFEKKELGIKYYGRYVDDFVLIHPDKSYLRLIIPKIRDYLWDNLNLELHPDKIYLQSSHNGLQFLGAVIKPHRLYIASRTKGNFYVAVRRQNTLARDHKPSREEKEAFLSCMNSYLGILKHYRTFRLRKKLARDALSGWWQNHVNLSGNLEKFSLK